jgi:thioredoxin reductase (NADPH)
VTFKSGKRVPGATVGIFIGSKPDTKWLPKKMEFVEDKINTNDNYETNIPGVFAVGDIRHGSIGRVGAAMGEGQFAARRVWDYLDRERTERSERSLFDEK